MMKHRTSFLALAGSLPLLIAFTAGCAAQDIRRGQAMDARPNSIWFQNKALLARWQQLKRSGGDAALKSYQDEKLGNRDAWQFTYPLKVRVTRYDAAARQADVVMTTPGRMQNSKWIIDSSALETTRP